jgi:Sel1 repeat-containing protein
MKLFSFHSQCSNGTAGVGGRARAVVASLFLCAACATPSTAFAQLSGFLHEEESRFLPGLYYFHKGSEYSERGESESAMHAWELAAQWAVKEAQYNLGIAYFKGQGVPADRPRGLAWLALAAERKDAPFEESLAAAWDEASSEERDRANALWRELGKRYADAVALPRAEARFKNEMNQITGSRVGMPGHVMIWVPRKGYFDVDDYRRQMDGLAQINFGKMPQSHVDVGPLEPIDDSKRDGQAGQE